MKNETKRKLERILSSYMIGWIIAAYIFLFGVCIDHNEQDIILFKQGYALYLIVFGSLFFGGILGIPLYNIFSDIDENSDRLNRRADLPMSQLGKEKETTG